MVYLGFISRVLFAAIFLAAALGKAGNPVAFARTIRMIGMRSSQALMAAWLVIAYEVALGVLFALGIFPLLATFAALLLLALFAGVSIRVIRSRQNIPCNCFGEAHGALGNQTLLRSMLLAVPVGIYFGSTLSGAPTWWPTTIDTTVALLSLVIAVILLMRWLLVATTLVALVRNRRKYTIPNRSARRRAWGLLQGVRQEGIS